MDICHGLSNSYLPPSGFFLLIIYILFVQYMVFTFTMPKFQTTLYHQLVFNILQVHG